MSALDDRSSDRSSRRRLESHFAERAGAEVEINFFLQ